MLTFRMNFISYLYQNFCFYAGLTIGADENSQYEDEDTLLENIKLMNENGLLEEENEKLRTDLENLSEKP